MEPSKVLQEPSWPKPRLQAFSNADALLPADAKSRSSYALEKPHLQPSKSTYDRQTDDSFFKSLRWSSDGSTILAVSEDNTMRTFLVPIDLLADDRDVNEPVVAHSIFHEPENVYSTAIYPFFSLQEQSSTVFLSACASQPIHLVSALLPRRLASFPLVDPHTEAYITPHALTFSRSGTSFLAGSNSQIAVFDLTRSYDGPCMTLPTIPSRRSKLVGGGVGMKGIIATLDESLDGVLASATFTRWIGLYDQGGQGDCIASWPLQGGGGNGVSQVLWDALDARYLYVAERKSDVIRVYDIRKTGEEVGKLTGRKAYTNQRLYVDQVLGPNGPEIWAGGTDGICRVWQDLRAMTDDKSPDWSWQAHNDPITAVSGHHSGAVVATSSGQRARLQAFGSCNEDEDDKTQAAVTDNSLKFWSII